MTFDTSELKAANLPIIWIQGGPGSGKGTQCEEIAKKSGYLHISSGDLLRAEVLSGSAKGMELFRTMESGSMVPVSEVMALLAEAMTKKISTAKGFLLDGFPADLEQADMFEQMIGNPTDIIFFEANDIILAERLKARGNFDDKDESITKRIANFNEKTRPVIDKYAKSVKKVFAERSEAEILADVCKILGV